MSAHFDSITNRGEYLSAHYFAEQLSTDLKKGLFATWTRRESDEHDPRTTPRQRLRTLRGTYLDEDVRGYFVAAAETDAAATEGDAGSDLGVRLATYDNP